MNISLLTPKFTLSNQIQTDAKPYRNATTSSKLSPLKADTVSFSGGKQKVVKTVVNTINGLRADKVSEEGEIFYDLPASIAQAMASDAIVPMGYFQNIMKEFFRREISASSGQNKPIQKLGFRIKEWKKIEKKLETLASKKRSEAIKRGEDFTIKNKTEAKKLVDDVIGGRIVMRDKSKKAVAKELNLLGDMAEQNKFKITQIEVYAPQIESADSIPYYVIRSWKNDFGWQFSEKELNAMAKEGYFSYAEPKELEKLAKRVGLDINNPEQFKIENRSNGYPAIHLRLEFPDGSTGEIQIMDRDVEFFKEALEDDRYKALCNKGKEIPKAIVDRWNLLKKKENVEIAKLHQQYTFWTYITQMLKRTEDYERRVSQKFLLAPESLRKLGLGYNQVFQLARETKKTQSAIKK